MGFLDGLTEHLSNIAEKFADVDPRLLVLAGLLHVTNHLLRSVAWRNVLAAAYPNHRVPLLGVTAAYTTGIALNAIVPARGGDAAKLALTRAEIRGSTLTTIGATITVLLPFDLLASAVAVLLVLMSGAGPLTVDLGAVTSRGGWIADHTLLAVTVALLALLATGFLVRHLRCRLRDFWAHIRQGGAIFRTPRRYLTRVALLQAIAWTCRIGVVMCLLAAFGLPATLTVAAFVMVLAGMSTVVAFTPGGAGTQQVVLAYALSEAASAAAVMSFSIGMQAGVTAVNALLGVGAAMVACGSLRGCSVLRSRLSASQA